MDDLEIFSRRLKSARVMKGLSMEGLCSLLNNELSKMSISKYENGCMAPNSNVLIKLANALEQPIDYFFRPFSVDISSIQFRKKSKLSAKQESMIRETVSDKIERYLNIEEICNASVNFKKPDMYVSTGYDAILWAKALRSMWKIGTDPITNMISLLEEHGIKVFEIQFDSSFDGFSAYVNQKYPIIVLNRNFQSERKRLTLAHELGHIVLSFNEDFSQKDIEYLCFRFGSEFLLPDDVFVSFVGINRSSISYPELSSIQRNYGISCDALMHKAKDCEVISDSAYSSYFRRKNSNIEQRRVIDQSLYPNEESTRFERLVFRALSSSLISESKASSLLNMPLSQVRNEMSMI